eukprot:4575812-Pleurochrysis_carterae.AAC.1
MCAATHTDAHIRAQAPALAQRRTNASRRLRARLSIIPHRAAYRRDDRRRSRAYSTTTRRRTLMPHYRCFHAFHFNASTFSAGFCACACPALGVGPDGVRREDDHGSAGDLPTALSLGRRGGGAGEAAARVPAARAGAGDGGGAHRPQRRLLLAHRLHHHAQAVRGGTRAGRRGR